MRTKTRWTFVNLLARLRANQVCQPLVHSKEDLAQIALWCGFGKQSRFPRVFGKLIR
jgi:transcriptional regulator GlxA family with amidase domain